MLWVFLLLVVYSAKAQIGRTANWYFGKNAGLKFTDTGVAILKDGKINTWEGCSSISDENGNLLLYSDGKTLWNKYHTIVKNGTGLLGDISSTQSALLLPLPKNDSIYVLITTPYALDYNIGMNYSLINIKGNNDSGVVIKKNILLHNNSAEKIAAINHQNGQDIWVVGHEFGNNRYYAYLLTEYGFNVCPVTSEIGNPYKNIIMNQGCLKTSFNGQYLVNNYIYKSSTLCIEIFKFQNGNIKNYNNLSLNSLSYGCEFSKNENYLYVTDDTKLFQINLLNLNIHVLKYSKYNNTLGSIQVGLNNKLYVANNNDSFLGVINNPDSAGAKCNFNPNGQWLGTKTSQFGLPNFNQSYFYTPALDYTYQLQCYRKLFTASAKDTFNASAYSWLKRPLYSNDTFVPFAASKHVQVAVKDTGTFQIRLIAHNSYLSDTITKTITFYDSIPKQFLGRDTIFASASPFSKLLSAPNNAFCNRWLFNDSLIASSDSLPASQFGTYICQSTNRAFCQVADTILISPCKDSLNLPAIIRSRDSLFVANFNGDTLQWFKHGVLVQSGSSNFIHLKDTGAYTALSTQKWYCPKISQRFFVSAICLDTLPVPIIARSRDSLFVANFNGDTLQWFNNGVLVRSSDKHFIHLNSTGTYRVRVLKAFHCSKSSADYTVTSLCIDSLKTPIISRRNDSLLVLNLLADSFVWYHNTIQIQTGASNTLPLSDTGTYSVTALKQYLCPRSSVDFKVHQLSTENRYTDELIHLYPNPSDGIVYFSCPSPFVLIVSDALGKTVLSQTEMLPVTLPKGIYLFRFILDQQVVYRKVVVL